MCGRALHVLLFCVLLYRDLLWVSLSAGWYRARASAWCRDRGGGAAADGDGGAGFLLRGGGRSCGHGGVR